MLVKEVTIETEGVSVNGRMDLVLVGRLISGVNRQVVCAKLVEFFFHAEVGIRVFCLSRGLGDEYKREPVLFSGAKREDLSLLKLAVNKYLSSKPLLYKCDATDEMKCVDLGVLGFLQTNTAERESRGMCVFLTYQRQQHSIVDADENIKYQALAHNYPDQN